MVANKYAFLQITRRRFLNEWEAFKKVISRRNIRRRITIPLTLSKLKLLRRIIRTDNIPHSKISTLSLHDALPIFIAIVCCYKGMTASGGAEGVGRAVNQAVVISLMGVAAFNYVFTQTLLATHPELQTLR